MFIQNEIIFAAVLLVCALWSMDSYAASGNGAVILNYNRIGENAYPDENLRLEQFEAQLNVLKNGGYTILPVPDIVSALKNETTLPDKTIGITFDGAYRSAFEKAMPLLIADRIPFTVFFSSEKADGGDDQHMLWKDLKSLRRYDFVDFGMHPALYTRMHDFSKLENRAHMNRAVSDAREQLGVKPDLFAYPFGEYNADSVHVVNDYGFSASFGLHSSAIGPLKENDNRVLPRFVMTERYGNLERFLLVSSALPYAHFDLEPEFPTFTNEIPAIGFSVPDTQAHILKNTTCFFSGAGKAETHLVGQNRIEIRSPNIFYDERVRLNCTALADKGNEIEEDRWHWFGLLLHREVRQPINTSEN